MGEKESGMTFEIFAQAHGLILQHAEVGKWVRVPTEDHPRKKNGSYKYLGDVGWCMNFATMTEPATWFADKGNEIKIDHEAIARARQKAAKELRDGRAKAARKAEWVLSQCQTEKHGYLNRKGFPDATGLVYEGKLVIPMRVGTALVGIQAIDEAGNKKFLFGQRCAGAEYVIDGGGADWWCEGMATGLSLRAVLATLKIRHRIHVCFSAGNLAKMAKSGTVIADNDASGTGQAAAESTGLRWWMPPDINSDLNDRHIDIGLFRLSQDVRLWLLTAPKNDGKL